MSVSLLIRAADRKLPTANTSQQIPGSVGGQCRIQDPDPESGRGSGSDLGSWDPGFGRVWSGLAGSGWLWPDLGGSGWLGPVRSGRVPDFGSQDLDFGSQGQGLARVGWEGLAEAGQVRFARIFQFSSDFRFWAQNRKSGGFPEILGFWCRDSDFDTILRSILAPIWRQKTRFFPENFVQILTIFEENRPYKKRPFFKTVEKPVQNRVSRQRA